MIPEEEFIEDKIPCKIILVGDSGVGKTSIINRYINKYTGNQKSTIGASYANKLVIIDDYKINFDIWDTAGEERFRSVNKIFYKEAYICILVYDITNHESFENIKNYWHPIVNENSATKIIYGVAGNKIDLYEEEKVDEKEVREYCNSIDAMFHTTSAKENTYIDDIFTDLGKKFINSDLFKYLICKSNEEQKKKIDLDNKNNSNKKKCC